MNTWVIKSALHAWIPKVHRQDPMLHQLHVFWQNPGENNHHHSGDCCPKGRVQTEENPSEKFIVKGESVPGCWIPLGDPKQWVGFHQEKPIQ